MKLSTLTIAILGAVLSPSLALAQAAPAAAAGSALSAGVMVYDPQGGEVGKIESVASDSVVLDTGSNKATLPKSAFASGAKGPTVNATKAQIDALVAASAAKASAALDASLIPGAQVRGKAGTVIGSVKEVAGDQVILERSNGGPVSLNKRAFTAGPSGLSITMTAGELEAATAQSAHS